MLSFEQIFKKSNQKIKEKDSFIECFEKLLDDLISSSELINKYLGNDRLIENINSYREAQESLVSNFQEKINNIDYDISLIQSKTAKGELQNIEEQNEKINSLLFNVLCVNSRFFGGTDNKEKESAKPLYEKIRNGLKILEDAILKYNERAKEENRRELTTVASAREKATKDLRSYIDSQK